MSHLCCDFSNAHAKILATKQTTFIGLATVSGTVVAAA
eukprot:CAMPEP_0174732024 /NCGR_PEP_ID=MMETSP1094-20130205/58634_1 /TAXON_ID=156173 /ORGANISM="Chrysochromulina brevifilum, Strain UTEX LB 985" /LENGTH=37 /DNA_ID= /DNA_START= /DNA_END= /DNA_ORIENTATION=